MPTVHPQYTFYLILNLDAVIMRKNKEQLQINCFHYNLTFKKHNVLLFILEM